MFHPLFGLIEVDVTRETNPNMLNIMLTNFVDLIIKSTNVALFVQINKMHSNSSNLFKYNIRFYLQLMARLALTTPLRAVRPPAVCHVVAPTRITTRNGAPAMRRTTAAVHCDGANTPPTVRRDGGRSVHGARSAAHTRPAPAPS